MANKRYLKVVTLHSCGKCKEYVTNASKYIEVKEYDVSQIRVKGVPYSYLIENNKIIKEWLGYDLEPLFSSEEKMKIKFNKDCQDRYLGVDYHEGDVIEFPGPRAEEILRTGVAEAVDGKDSKKKK